MKKKTLLLVAACALVLTACGTKENTVSSEQSVETQINDVINETWLDETPVQESAVMETESEEVVASEIVIEEAELVEGFYFAATVLSDAEVESYAADVKAMILNGDWETFAYEISYPIIVDGLTMEDAVDLMDYIADSTVSEEFLAAIEAETCVGMFNSQQGITLGAAGEIWLGEVQNDDGSFSLQVVEINNMFDE